MAGPEIEISADEAPKPVVIDVTGQEGGPSPEEQALVDAEQKSLMAQRAEERKPQELEEARARNDKLQAALERQSEMRSVLALLKNIDDRLRVVENKK